MKVREETVTDYEQEGVTLQYVEFTQDFAELKDYALHKGETITVFGGNKEAVSVRVEDIFYFEAVGERAFAYLEEQVYEVKQRLYQIEEKLRRRNICRASKSVLINIDHIISVRPALNGRLFARMENGEDVLISRNYAKQVAKHVMEEEDEGI